jgi:hypothetical protein
METKKKGKGGERKEREEEDNEEEEESGVISTFQFVGMHIYLSVYIIYIYIVDGSMDKTITYIKNHPEIRDAFSKHLEEFLGM